jgi:hypothetical protein
MVVAFSACGGAQEPAKTELAETTGTTSAKSTSPAADMAVDEVALHLVRAAMADDRAAVLGLSMTFDQMAELTTKVVDRASYDEELQSFITKSAREARENPGFTVVGARVAETKKLPPGEKLKREIELAAVVVVVEQNGEKHDAPFPLFFIRTAAGWRFTPKK